ncbi:MAG: HAD-IA family hydrolase [Cyclobacteriaceae bacterium]|jgi:putative hydrolase of the HAD superfamily|nr:HAD-IA family hydrolase [Cyclobacteriaceae bacterium]
MDRDASSLKIVFFDIGGVLLSDGWGHVARQAAAKKFKLDYQEMDILHDFIFNTYEIGKITLDNYLDTVVFNNPRDFTKEDFKTFMFAQSQELPNMLEWLKQWRKDNPDIRIISINNEPKELNDYRIKKFELHECFDAFISSCEVGMRKPDPGIYNLAMGIAHATSEQCIYFDDRPMLIDAAQKLGIKSYHHKGLPATKKILETFRKSK